MRFFAIKWPAGVHTPARTVAVDNDNPLLHLVNGRANGYILFILRISRMEVTKALAALQPLYGKNNIEIVTADGHRVRGIVRSMKTTGALSTPSVKVERADGEIVKVLLTSIIEIINHNHRTAAA